jgi:archaellum component FlaC
MEKKDYQKRLEEIFDELSTKINIVKEKLEVGGSETREKLKEEIDLLETKRTAALNQLQEIKTASSDGWSLLRAGADRAIEDLKFSYEQAVARLKQIGG